MKMEKSFYRSFIKIPIIIAICVICLSIIASLFLGEREGIKEKGSKINYENLKKLSNKLQKEMRYLSKNKYSSDKRKITLTSSEINTLFNLYFSGKNSYRTGVWNIYIDSLEFKNGKFFIIAYKKVPVETPIGSYINIYSKISTSKIRRNVKIRINSFFLGKVKIPSILYEGMFNLEKRLQKTINRRPIINKLIKNIKTYNNKIQITYSPINAKKLIPTSLPSGFPYF